MVKQTINASLSFFAFIKGRGLFAEDYTATRQFAPEKHSP